MASGAKRGAKPIGELLAMGVIAGLVAFGLALANRPHASRRAPARAANMLDARDALFELHAGAARLSVQSRDRALSRDLDLALVVDGVSRPLVLGRDDLHASGDALRATFAVTFGEPGSGESSIVDATLELRADVARDALDV